MSLPPWNTAASIFLFPFAFVGLWCLVSLIIALIGGWNALAKHFCAAKKPDNSEWFYLESGSLGASEYKGCLLIGVTPDGLYLAVLPIFRLGHPPLLIPWAAFGRIKTEKVFWRVSHEATVALSGNRYDDATITLYNQRVADAIQWHIGKAVV